MKKLFFTCLFQSFFLIYSQQIYFNNRYDYNNNYEGAFTILDLDSGYLCAAGYSGILLQFIDLEGELIWQKSFGDTNHIYYIGLSNAFIPIHNNDYVLGSSIKDTSGNSDGLITKFNKDFDTVWTKRFYWPYFNVFYQCKQTPDSGFILIGAKDILGSGNNSTWLVKTDKAGIKIWEKTFNGYGGGTIIVTKEGNFVFTNGKNLTKTDSAGNIIWNKYLGFNIGNLSEAGNAEYIGCYSKYDNTINNYYDQYTPGLIRLDTSGTIIWQKTFGPSRLGSWLSSVFETPDGDIIAVGQTSNQSGTPSGNGFQKAIVLKAKANGDSVWYRTVEYNPCEYNNSMLRDIKLTHDNGFVAAGFITPSTFICPGDSGQQDMWVLKMDSCGCLYPDCDSVCAGLVGVEKNKEKANDKLQLTIFPIPAENFVFVELHGEIITKGEIRIINITGQEVKKFNISGHSDRLIINSAEVGNGIFLIQFLNDGIPGQSRKIILQD